MEKHHGARILAVEFPSLASLISSRGRCLNIRVVTPDLLGPVKNGGIGTACAYLARALAEAGHEVEILFTGDAGEKPWDWIRLYEAQSIRVTVVRVPDGARYFPDYPPLAMSREVYRILAEKPLFDLALFMEWQGNGFYALHAKKVGLAFQNTAMAVVIHSPTIWHALNNAAPAQNPLQACTWHMERASIELADAVISPSQYMLNWCVDHGYKLPQAFMQPNILEWPKDWKSRGDTPIGEIVFFGRLEYRKGLAQFCAALDILAKRSKLPPRVAFLGKCAWMGKEHSLDYIARRSKNWPKCDIRLLPRFGHEEAVKYLCGGGRIAVMPSVADNSPYTVYECLVAGIPFLARNTGGIGELVAPSDRDHVLFTDNPLDLADKLQKNIAHKPRRAALNFDLTQNHAGWSNGLVALVEKIRANANAKLPENPAISQNPFISVCMTHYNRPGLLRQSVQSFLDQDYQNFELILADDGSTDKDAKKYLDQLEGLFKQRDWKILRLENGYVGRARNQAAMRARGDWLLFFDDDNVAKPDMLKKCAAAASQAGSGMVGLAFDVFEGREAPSSGKLCESFLPLGAMVSYSIIQNAIADATSLVHKASFERAGGFSEDYGLGHEDFEFYLRLSLAGEAVGILPEPVFWYRREKNSMLGSTYGGANRMRSFRPFLDMLPAPLGEMAFMAHGMADAAGFFRQPDENITGPQGDPESRENVEAILDRLDKEGDPALADEFFIALLGAKAGETAILERKILHLARRGKYRELARALATYESNALGSLEFYGRVLERLFKRSGVAPVCPAVKTAGLREHLLQKVAASCGNDIRCNLLLAQAYGKLDANATMLGFFRALAEAERLYAKCRPDVAAVVASGELLCGLQHFSLYGKNEWVDWPCRALFANALKNLLPLRTMIINIHQQCYKYRDENLARSMLESLEEVKCGA